MSGGPSPVGADRSRRSSPSIGPAAAARSAARRYRPARLRSAGGRAVTASLLLLPRAGVRGRPARPPSPAPAPSPRRPRRVRPSAAPRVLASGLDVPWGIAFLPDGNALVTERNRRGCCGSAPTAVTRRRDRGRRRAQPGRAGCWASPSRPASPRTGRCSSPTPPPPTTASSGCAATTGRSTERRAAVVPGIPKGGIHDGGGLAFGPDGLLYVGTGEAGRRGPAQDPDDLGGKILRDDPGRRAGAGQPVRGLAGLELGHRNVQGLAWDPDGRITPPSSARTAATRST